MIATFMPDDDPLDRYRDLLKLFIRTRLHFLPPSIDASDIIQDVFLKAYVRRAQFEGKTEREYLGWLRAIVVNTLADTTRDPANKRAIRDKAEQSWEDFVNRIPSDHTSPIERAERADRLLQLAAALVQLTKDEQMALELRYLCNPPIKLSEIAKRLNRPTPKAVAHVLAGGLAKLQKILGKDS
jgi:RNA polymerase sigma-70 factor, ECF subfamily